MSSQAEADDWSVVPNVGAKRYRPRALSALCIRQRATTHAINAAPRTIRSPNDLSTFPRTICPPIIRANTRSQEASWMPQLLRIDSSPAVGHRITRA
ncbi:MAG: hypothetical protein QOE09_3450 [Ilumatobacteraceae bacterium]|jgi:hypothetical protein